MQNGLYSLPRLVTLDAARGLLIVFMALDHARYFLLREHPAEWWGGALPAYESISPFLERAISHLCAPGFFFLMGASMVLHAERTANRGGGRRDIVMHFVRRGFLLILLELVLVSPVWLIGGWGEEPFNTYGSPAIPGDGGPTYYYFGVISALGAAMTLTAFVLWLDKYWLLALSLLMMLLAPISLALGLQPAGDHNLVLRLLLSAGQSNGVLVQYPILPWCGAVFLGLLYGRVASRELMQRVPISLVIAIMILVVLGAVVALNWSWIDFGAYDPVRFWETFNFTKYPPSVGFLAAYLSMTVIAIWLLSLLSNQSVLIRLLSVYGSEPLFVYVLHLYLVLAIGLALSMQTKVYFFWMLYALVLALLWPACQLYKRRKEYLHWAVPTRFSPINK